MFEILTTIGLSSVKFALTFPLAVMQFRFSFLETVLWTNVGGLAGIYFFAFLSEQLLQWWHRTFGRKKVQQKRKPVFSKRNRRIVKIRQRYGLPGIALTTPVLLSIPVGTFLVVRYYRSNRARFLYLALANLIWSLIYTWSYTAAGNLLLPEG